MILHNIHFIEIYFKIFLVILTFMLNYATYDSAPIFDTCFLVQYSDVQCAAVLFLDLNIALAYQA